MTIVLILCVVTINVADGVDIDYGLVSDANFSTKGRVVTDHKVSYNLLGHGPKVNSIDPSPYYFVFVFELTQTIRPTKFTK